MNYINEINKKLNKDLKKLKQNLTKLNKSLMENLLPTQKLLLVLLIGFVGILGISRVVVQANSKTPATRTVTKYDIKGRVTGKDVYENKKNKLIESAVYNPETKKVKASKHFYKNTGKLSVARTYTTKGKIKRLDTWYNAKDTKKKDKDGKKTKVVKHFGKKSHTIIYDEKSKKIVKEIAFTPSGKVKAIGSFIEPIKRGKSSITSGFGSGRQHTGFDMAYSTGGITAGKPIYASNAGKVIVAEKNSNEGYGHHVIIDHGNGIRTVYGHMDKVKVHVGQIVWKNQKIGTIGTTGISTGPHVHFEYRVHNRPIDGIKYVRAAVFFKR